MKHQLRKENTCLNCGNIVPERFCSHCGQENIEPKETTGRLIGHFFSDITHYDSKFFVTLKDLLFRPGFLTREYFLEKRMRYLNPVRLYVFISFVFFLVLFFKNSETADTGDESGNIHYRNLLQQHLADSLRQFTHPGKKAGIYDSLRARVYADLAGNLDSSAVKRTDDEAVGMSYGNQGIKFTLTEEKYDNLHDYDSVQNTLPENEKDKGFIHWFIRTNVRLKNSYGSRRQVVVSENFQHSIPKMMFVVLPLFALFIKLFYNRKKYFYSQHIIFSIHFHSFMFLLLMFTTFLDWIFTGGSFQVIVMGIAILLLYCYLALALKKAYQQSIWLSLLKALSIGVLYIITLVICIVLLAFYIFFTA